MRGAPDGRHCATPIRPPTPRRPAHPKGTVGRPGPAPRPHTDRSWPPRSPGGAGASFRPSTRVVYEEKAISQAPGFLDDPEGLCEVLDVVDRLAEEPVQPGRSRTDRQICGGWGPAAYLPPPPLPAPHPRPGYPPNQPPHPLPP